MSDQHTERDEARRHHRRVAVVWGCDTHHTPAGQECQGCADQHELLTRAEIHPVPSRSKPTARRSEAPVTTRSATDNDDTRARYEQGIPR